MIEVQGFGDQIVAGAVTTLRVAITSLVFGLGVGLCGAVAKLCRFGVARQLADGYTTIVRGVPELLIILILYFGGTVALTALFGRYVEVDAFAAGVFALTIVFGYATEVLRGAILGVPSGQIEAAHALGLSGIQVWRLVIFPQMWRYALPGLGNLCLSGLAKPGGQSLNYPIRFRLPHRLRRSVGWRQHMPRCDSPRVPVACP
ncbi:ABC transporter permease subunit [Sinorhizobium medicae]|uniref:ABC transporter permease subunit n=1 Tax=Sinorhizobium medicae TaxID=110321 RepID=UPI0012964926|nr:ABC transporter permease subunit [Sinorhizobium meliloti]MDX0414977.1 ABC transporter permease subunit [Sinorhizobium medicae]MDX0476071.1 ABC transporter permease subunit [Sinorhizobium medicae]MQV83433.1 ABC transporter permease subunit [Sinorhizobium medicae]MQV89917.1 ABC transporter permease subunit [Sinorhizobium medicae]